MPYFKISSLFISFVFASQASFAGISVVANRAQKYIPTEQDIYNLYLGIEKNSRIELLNQDEGQAARAEFFNKFLHHSEIQMKQKWSMLVFSGNRIPSNSTDDRAILEYVKTHPNSVGYVDSEYLTKNKPSLDPQDQIVVLFKIQ